MKQTTLLFVQDQCLLTKETRKLLRIPKHKVLFHFDFQLKIHLQKRLFYALSKKKEMQLYHRVTSSNERS